MTTITTVISRPNPYVGPRPYREGEVIYGRERETSELLDILISERIVLLYSASGAGKSSLLNAAILPKMMEQGFQVYPVIRVNMDPPTGLEMSSDFNRYIYSCLQSIEESLPEEQRFSVEDLVKLKFKDYLVKYHERAHTLNPDQNSDAPVLLVIDQAEEVIRISMTDRPKKLDFFVQLGEVLRDKNIWALIAMREDYLASFDPYLRPIPTRLANRYRLTFLDADAAIKAIQLPAQSVGVEFPDECARQLVDDLRATLVQQQDGTTTQELGPTVEPVQLQVVCRRLWSNLPPTETVISSEHIKAVGSVNRALADYYALQTASVANMAHVPEREIREWFERKLITASGIRGQVLLTPEKSDGLDNNTIWMLERAYLIRAEKRGGATWFELAHDRFVRPIRENNAEWIEKHLTPLQRRADLWNLQGRPDSLLVADAEFSSLESWVNANTKTVTLVEKDFYRDSMKAHQRTMREHRTEILIRWLLVASIISTVVAVIFFFKTYISEQTTRARELAAASLSNVQTNPELSLLLALEGLDVTTEPKLEIIQALHQALPEMHIMRSSNVENGHADKVYSVVYSPDGKSLASASKDGTVKIWDASSLTVRKTLKLVEDRSKYHNYGAFAAAYSPDGKSLATVAADGKLIVWDTADWKPRYQVTADDGMIFALTYSHDGKYIATGGGESVARIWDAATGKKVYDLGGTEGNQSGIETVVFSLDNSILFVAGDHDKTIYAWDVGTGKLAYKLNAPGTESVIINGLALSPDGKLLASSGSDRLIRLWDIAKKESTMEIPGHVDWVYGMAFTPDGKSLVSAGGDRTIRIWDVKYGRSQTVFTGPSDQVFWVAISPDGRYMASASADSLVRLWDISLQGSHEVMTMDHQDKVHDVVYSPDGKYIASAGTNGVINLWDAANGTLFKKLFDVPRSAETLFWSHDGRYLAAGYASGQALIWDMKTDKPALMIPGDSKLGVWGVSLNFDNSLLATSNDAGVAHIYNTKTGAEVAVLDANKQLGWGVSAKDLWMISALFSPDGKYLATSYSIGRIVIWDWKTGKDVMIFTDHTDIVENLTYNADGSLLASASDDGNIILWDMNPALTDHKKAVLSGHIALVNDVAFSPDSNLLVSGGGDEVVKVWDLKTGHLMLNLYGNTNIIHGVAFSPDGKHIVSGANDRTVRVFTLDVPELLDLAQKRVTRSMTDDECEEYLHATCQVFHDPYHDPLKPITDFFNEFLHW